MVSSRYPGSYDPLLGYVPTPGASGRGRRKGARAASAKGNR